MSPKVQSFPDVRRRHNKAIGVLINPLSSLSKTSIPHSYAPKQAVGGRVISIPWEEVEAIVTGKSHTGDQVR